MDLTCNSEGVVIHTISQSSKIVPYYSGTSYIEFTVEYSNINTAQAEYGTVATSYEQFQERLNPDLIPTYLSDSVINDRKIDVDSKLDDLYNIKGGSGKNLFDKSKIETGKFISKIGGVGSNVLFSLSEYTRVLSK